VWSATRNFRGVMSVLVVIRTFRLPVRVRERRWRYWSSGAEAETVDAQAGLRIDQKDGSRAIETQ
jgi:hypothetical protein